MARPFQINYPLTDHIQRTGGNLGQFMMSGRPLPLVLTPKEEFIYHVFGMKGRAAMTSLDLRRERGSTYQQVSTTSSTATDQVEEYGAVVKRDRRTIANADLSLFEEDAETAAIQVIGSKENDLVTLLETDANFGTAADAATYGGSGVQGAWDDDASNPKAQINLAKRTIRTATGGSDGEIHLYMPEEVFQAVQLHALVRDQFKFTSSEFPAEAVLARYFEVAAIHVGISQGDSANLGQDASMGYLMGNHCAVVKLPRGMRASGRTDCWAKEFNLSFDLPGEGGQVRNVGGISIEQYSDPDTRSVATRAADFWKLKLSNASCGVRIKSVA